MITPTGVQCVYFEDDRVEGFDIYKAIEAQSSIALAAIRNRIEAAMPDDRLAEISAWVDVLMTMLLSQGHQIQDCRDALLYTDGSAVFRLVPDGTVADVEGRYYLENSDYHFNYIGEVAEHLFTASLSTGLQVEVNDPPVREPREPSHLVTLLRERYRTAQAWDDAATSARDDHD